MKSMSRRRFAKRSLAWGLGTALMPYARVRGANDDIRVAVAAYEGKNQELAEADNSK